MYIHTYIHTYFIYAYVLGGYLVLSHGEGDAYTSGARFHCCTASSYAIFKLSPAEQRSWPG
jgi:hypothetical protein